MTSVTLRKKNNIIQLVSIYKKKVERKTAYNGVLLSKQLMAFLQKMTCMDRRKPLQVLLANETSKFEKN